MSALSGESGSGTAGDFAAMLAMIADPKAMQAKYAELAAKQKAAEDVLALVGPAKEILKLRADADRDRAEAKGILEQARQQVTKMASDASGNATQVSQSAQAKAESLIRAAEAEKGVAAARMAEVTQAKAEQVKQQTALDARDKQLFIAESNVSAREVDLRDRTAAVADRETKVMAVRDLVVAQWAEHAKTLKKV